MGVRGRTTEPRAVGYGFGQVRGVLPYRPYSYVRRQLTTKHLGGVFCGVDYVSIESTPVDDKAFGCLYSFLTLPDIREIRGKYCIVEYIKILNKPLTTVGSSTPVGGASV